MTWQHTVAILLGGQSTRMGEPKHLAKLSSGNTLLSSMATFANQISPRVVIVGGEVQGFKSIQDLRLNQGPVAGIEALLHSNIDEKYLVVGCDMPRLQPADVCALLEANESAIYSFQNQLLGLPIMVSALVKDACSSYLENGGRSIKGLFKHIPHQVIQANETLASSCSSINTRSDLDEFAFEEWCS